MSLLLTFGKKSVIQRAISVLRKFGTDAHAYIPGGSISTYGPELVVNGDGNSLSDWASTNWVLNSGKFSNLVLAAGGDLLQDAGCSVGKTYLVTFDISDAIGSGVYISAAGNDLSYYGNGTQSVITVCTSTTKKFRARKFASSGGSIDNISVKEILTITSVVLNGLSSGNYTDTAGTQFTTKDQFVGLDLDAMGSLGAELITALDFGAFTRTAVVTGYTATSLTTNGVGGAYKLNVLTLGSTHAFTVSGTCDTAWRLTNSADNNIYYSFSSGAFNLTFYAVSGGGDPSVYFRLGEAGTLSISAISIKRVTGIHATQGTAGNKPVLRQGPVNLLLNSATLSTQSVAVAASPHTLSFTGTGTVTKSGTATGALVGTGATDRVTQTFTPIAGTLTLTVTGSVTSAQLQLGSTATIYIPTTSAKASAGTGPSYWEFGGDGTPTDYLGLGSVPFQMSDDHWVVVASSCTASGAINTIVDLAGSATGQRCAALYYNSSRNLVAVWTDDTAVARTITHGSSLGDSVNVATAIKIGNNKRLRVNGVQSGSVETSVMGTTTISRAVIGRANWVSSYLNGNIYAVICGKGAITDADLFLVEKLAANLAGVTLA